MPAGLVPAGPPAAGEPGASSPGSLIITFAGLYLREIGGWIAVADLIGLLEPVGAVPTSIRQALSRIKSRGLLAAERRTGRAGYRLTEAGLADLAIGDARIFRYGQATESDGWVLAVFSVPEHARSERHRLRRQLAWLGFGTVSSGVWIAPAPLSERAQAHIRTSGLDAYVSWFTGRARQPDVEHWWDLDLLASLYADFLRDWEPQVQRAVSVETGAAALAGYLRLVDGWRQFPRIDPGLPAALLSADWPGRRAFEVFSVLRQRWSAPAEQFVHAQLGR